MPSRPGQRRVPGEAGIGGELAMIIEPGDRIRFDSDSHGIVTRTMLDREYDRGVMINRFEWHGQPYDYWVSEDRINSVETKPPAQPGTGG